MDNNFCHFLPVRIARHLSDFSLWLENKKNETGTWVFWREWSKQFSVQFGFILKGIYKYLCQKLTDPKFGQFLTFSSSLKNLLYYQILFSFWEINNETGKVIWRLCSKLFFLQFGFILIGIFKYLRQYLTGPRFGQGFLPFSSGLKNSKAYSRFYLAIE